MREKYIIYTYIIGYVTYVHMCICRIGNICIYTHICVYGICIYIDVYMVGIYKIILIQ